MKIIAAILILFSVSFCFTNDGMAKRLFEPEPGYGLYEFEPRIYPDNRIESLADFSFWRGVGFAAKQHTVWQKPKIMLAVNFRAIAGRSRVSFASRLTAHLLHPLMILVLVATLFIARGNLYIGEKLFLIVLVSFFYAVSVEAIRVHFSYIDVRLDGLNVMINGLSAATFMVTIIFIRFLTRLKILRAGLRSLRASLTKFKALFKKLTETED